MWLAACSYSSAHAERDGARARLASSYGVECTEGRSVLPKHVLPPAEGESMLDDSDERVRGVAMTALLERGLDVDTAARR